MAEKLNTIIFKRNGVEYCPFCQRDYEEKQEVASTPLNKIAQLEHELGQECTKCINTFSGFPMLVAKGATLQCRLRTCNRKKHKAKMKELKSLEKELHEDC